MDVGALLLETCRQTVDQDYLLARQQRARWNGMAAAVRTGDTPFLFAWLVEVFSYQGIADARALAYMDAHERLTFSSVARGLEQSPACPKLATYWHYAGCGYTKMARTCSEPDLLPGCPLPRHDLRNGCLNQMAYALFLFIRDVCGGDLVGWIDDRLAEADDPDDPQREAGLRDALLAPLSRIHGISYKVLAMALAELLLAGDPARERWVAAGAVMLRSTPWCTIGCTAPSLPKRSGPNTLTAACATSPAAAPRSWSAARERSMPAPFALRGPATFHASCSMPSGASAPRAASASATATGSTTALAACSSTVR